MLSKAALHGLNFFSQVQQNVAYSERSYISDKCKCQGRWSSEKRNIYVLN